MPPVVTATAAWGEMVMEDKETGRGSDTLPRRTRGTLPGRRTRGTLPKKIRSGPGR